MTHYRDWETLIERPKAAGRPERNLNAKCRRAAQKLVKEHPEFELRIERDYALGQAVGGIFYAVSVYIEKKIKKIFFLIFTRNQCNRVTSS